MSNPVTFRRAASIAGIFTGFWLLLVLAFAAQLVFTASFPWMQAIRGSLSDWLPWVILSPGVVWLSRRFPLEIGRLRWSVPAHAVGCAVAVLVAGWISDALLPRPGGPGGSGRGEMRRGEREGFFPPPRPPGAEGVPQGPPREFGGPGFEGREMRPARQQRRFWALGLWTRSKFNLPVYWVIVSGAHAFSLYRRVQERDRRALELSAGLSQAKLQALRLQMQPHFLFNTLNAISTLVHRDPEKADEMIVNLSELLRLSLDASEHEVALRRELEILDRYLAIEEVRFGERLRIERAVEPATLDALVPALMIQTIVENAVRHGIEPRATAGMVALRVSREGDALKIVVADDGVGLSRAGRSGGQGGVGLANTESRLAEMYGTAGKLVLREPPEGGLSVEITVPFRTENPRAP